MRKNKKNQQQQNSNKGPSGGSRDRSWEQRGPSEPGQASGGIEFRDRSGKVHQITPKRGGASAGPTPLDRPAKRRESFTPPPETGVETRRSRPRRDVGVPERGSKTGLIKLKATVDKNRKGFGFLSFENREYEDAFVPPREAETLFHGDRVEVTISGRGEVHQIRVLEHRFKEITGRFTPHPAGAARGGWLVYERRKAREEVYIPTFTQKIVEGDWLRAKLVFHESGSHRVTAEIIEVYGQQLPAYADVTMIANEYNLIEEHPENSEAEAKTKTLEIPGRDLEGREDLRKVPFITIDGETARDFDDAIYVQRQATGGYVLWVAIADVSHYVQEGSALDQDARSRGTSVYFPERAFHMLPRALSENLCSLVPHQPRLTMVARMEYDAKGVRTETELMEAVIQSHRRATYNEIQVEWDANRSNPMWEFEPHFGLYHLIRKARSDRGSIDFDFPEAEILVEPNGEVVSIKNRSRLDAHRLIEEFMISANEAVTEWAMEKKWPFLYRVHDIPAQQALEKFQKLADNVGVKFSIGDGSPKVMAELVQRLKGHPAQTLLNMALLRSMKQAAYSSTHGVHFGLASEGYTHFTSPIRRYPDLVVHRVLRRALRAEKGLESKLDERSRGKLEEDLADVCEHCSYRERLASDAERDAIKLKQVRLMQRHLGSEFDGKVNGMTENGLFILLNDPFVEGMLPKDSMTDDFYQFNEERMVFFGKRKRRTFQIGDLVKVSVARADIDTRQVDFALVEGGKKSTELSFDPAFKVGPEKGERPRRGKRPERNDKPGSRGGKGSSGPGKKRRGR